MRAEPFDKLRTALTDELSAYLTFATGTLRVYHISTRLP
jgi:hypothetical protein